MIMILAAGRIRLPQASGQGRKTVAIGQRVNFLPCLAHGTILDKTGHISGDILRGKQADHGDVAHLLQGAEDSCDPLRGASVRSGIFQSFLSKSSRSTTSSCVSSSKQR